MASIRGIHVYRNLCVIEKYDLQQGRLGLVHDWQILEVGAGAHSPALGEVRSAFEVSSVLRSPCLRWLIRETRGPRL